MDHLVFIQQNPLPFATLLGVQFLSTTPSASWRRCTYEKSSVPFRPSRMVVCLWR
jgi:hypothetical protein